MIYFIYTESFHTINSCATSFSRFGSYLMAVCPQFSIKLFEGRRRGQCFEVIYETTTAVFQLEYIIQRSTSYFEMLGSIYKTDLDNFSWAKLKTPESI